MTYEVRVEQAVERPTAVVAVRTTWEEFPRLWKPLLDGVWSFIRTAPPGLHAGGHNVMLYKDDVPNVEVGVEVTRAFPPAGRVVPSVLPAGRVVRTLHRGPYECLGEAYAALRAWSDAHAIRLAGPHWEIYGDWREDPAELETEIIWLLAL